MITEKYCDNIIRQNNSFFKRIESIDNKDFSIYSYRFTDFSEFDRLNARELRGICFSDSRVWFSVPKFFNLGQIPANLYENLKNKTIDRIYEKLDGSLISFVNTGDRIKAKSKTSFYSEQALEADRIYINDKEINFFINNYIYKFNLLFEYISHKNKVVVDYNCDTLKLIMIRDLEGNIIPFTEFERLESKIPDKLKIKSYDYSLDQLVKICKTSKEDIEGFIVYFTDGTIIKMKTDYYLERHKLLTNDASVEDIVKMVFEETVDDYISNFKDEKYNYILDIINKTHLKYKYLLSLLESIDYTKTRKELALKYNRDPDFDLIMKSIGNLDPEYLIRNHILFRTKKSKDYLSC